MTKRILLSILTLLVVCCLCSSALGLAGAASFAISEKGIKTQGDGNLTPRPTLKPYPTQTPTPISATGLLDATPTQKMPVGIELPPEIAARMDEIQQQVSQIRGLLPNQSVHRALMTPEDLQKRVIEDFFADYTADEARQDVAILSALGLLDSGYDLYKLYIDLYSEQIAGFYDDKAKEMYTIASEGFKGTERMTYAHEFTHTLQDQNYDLRYGMKMNDETCETETEYCAAVQSLIEGDATLTQQFWFFEYATDQDRSDVQEFYTTFSSPVFDSLPSYLDKDFLAPYVNGLEFVQSLYDIGGWAAVDEAYANPPVSTEQILHPEKYPDDTPMQVTLPDLSGSLGSGWEEVDNNVMGEWYTFLILAHGRDQAARVTEKDSRQAAAGWGGDRYVAYWHAETGAVSLVQRWKWDTLKDSGEFWDSFSQYASERWGKPDERKNNRLLWTQTPDGVVLVLRQADEVLWLMAPDRETAEVMLNLIPDFAE
jgi:hypothetical protein